METILKIKTDEGSIPALACEGRNLNLSKLLENEGIKSDSLVKYVKDIAENPDVRKEYISLIAEKLWRVSVIAEKCKNDYGYNLK